ncbi:MAG: MopE-related protein [Myxococcota bacterium]
MVILALFPFARAALPWECPAITVPADAHPYRDTDAEVSAVVATVRALVSAWEDHACAWTEVGEGDGESYERVERVCDDGRVRVEVVDEWWYGYGGADTNVTATVSVASGETYTALSYTYAGGSAWDGDDTASSSSTRVAWTGAVPGLPDDGWLVVEGEDVDTSGWWAERREVQTPGCAWTWSSSVDGTYGREWETVAAPDHTLYVSSGAGTTSPWCWADLPQAFLDSVPVGAVDETTWERDPADMDGDGWPAGDQDCDDTDPARADCLTEILGDGVDQDCNGFDATPEDTDGDGHAAEAYGGDDCNDERGYVYPGANDTAGDGVDADCDGRDDIDRDGDGYTTTGDDRPADCDDRAAGTFPDGAEIACDGIDQDCDGVDVCDDTGREDTGADDSGDTGDTDAADSAGDTDTAEPADTAVPPAEAPPSPPAPEADTGCGSTAAFLAFLPLLTLRRRR